MVKKILFISLALFGLLFSQMAEECFADAATQFKQAETYKKNKQYDQAEQIYQQILINFPDSNDALEAQKQLTCLYIATDSQQQADAAFAELTAGFSQHKEIAEAIWHVGRNYMKTEKLNKAEEAHQYNVGHFPADKYAMWSQVEIFHSHVRKGDNAAADAAVDKLLSVFASQPTLPKEIHQIANKYSKVRRREKAMELRKYNVARFPKDKYAMWSQVEIVCSYIRDPNAEEAVVNAAVEKLLGTFSEQPGLPRKIRDVGRRLYWKGKREKALELHRYNVEHYPEDEYAMWSQVEIVCSYTRDPNAEEAVVNAAVEKLLTNFTDNPLIARAVWDTAQFYRDLKKYEKANELYRYNVEYYPDDKYAMSSQVAIVKFYIGDGNDAAAADAAVDKLINVFSEQETLAKEIYKIANRYNKALELHRYNVEHYPADKYAMWSQIAIVKFYIGDGNDAAAADAAVDKLINVFSEQETLAKEIYKIADRYNKAGNREKALQLHKYNIDNFPADANAMWSQIDIVKFYIGDGNDAAAADAAVDKLINVFSEQETLAKEIYKIAERYQRLKRLDEAYECYQYVAENCDDDERALLSQQQVVYLSLQLEDDAGIDAAVEKLLTGFAGQPGLPEKICEIVKKLYQKGKREKALELHRYNVEHYPEDKYAMWSQIEIVKFYIGDGNDAAAADAAVDKLISVFSEQKTLAKEIYKIANRYNKAGKFEKGMQLHKYNIDNFPADANAMWSQVDIIYFHIGGNDAAAADAAVEKLLSVFSNQPSLPEAILQVGEKYNAASRSDKAMELWMRNVDNSPNNVNAMLSQLDIIYSYIDPNDGNDAAVDAAVDKLLTVFADQPTLPEKVYQIGNKYRDSGKYERAIQFYQLAAERWPEDKIAITSRVAIGKVHIELGNDEAVQAVIDGLNADANDHPRAAEAVFQIGEEHYFIHQYQKAIDVLELVCASYPEKRWPDSLSYLLATCYGLLNENNKAIEYYTEVVEKYPYCKYAYRAPYRLGIIYRRQKHYDKALYWFQKQRELYSDKLHAERALHCQGAIYLCNLEDYQAAAEIFQKHSEEYPEGEYANITQYNLAVCYHKLAPSAETRKMLQEARDKLYSDVITIKPIEKPSKSQEGG